MLLTTFKSVQKIAALRVFDSASVSPRLTPVIPPLFKKKKWGKGGRNMGPNRSKKKIIVPLQI